MSNVPKLRFDGFSDTWRTCTFEQICQVIDGDRGANYPKSEDFSSSGYCLFLNAKNVTKRGFAFDDAQFVTQAKDEALSKGKLNLYDLVLTTRGSVGNFAYYSTNIPYKQMRINSGMVILRPKESINPEYFYIASASPRVRKQVSTIAFGSAQPALTVKEIKRFTLSCPAKPEQQKIAAFLTAVDTKIEQLTQKEALLKQYKKGVMQKIFSQEIRFKADDGSEFPEWEDRRLSDVLHEHKSKSTGSEEVFSVSVHKGLVNQVEHLGRSFAASDTSNYNLVKPNDIVYTKSPTGDFPYGIIKQSRVDKAVLVSPLYGVFTPESVGLGYMLHVYFESVINTHNYLHSIIQKGAKNTINITNTTFTSKTLKLPTSRNEQNKIGKFLSSIDTKIDQLVHQLETAKTFKKGLLQQMFV